MKKNRKIFYIEESSLAERICKSTKKKVLIIHSTSSIPLLNTTGLYIATIRKENKYKMNNWLVRVCIDLAKEYEEIYIAPEIAEECTEYFNIFLGLFSKDRNVSIYCPSKA